MADDPGRILFPGSIGELLQTCRREPGAVIYAGGTYLLSQRPGRFVELPDPVISLQDVEELRRVARTERYLELGAALPLRQIMRLGANNVPTALYEALRHIGPPAVAGLATLGGNLAVPGRLLTAVPVLAVMDARAELRRHGGTRWLPVSRVHRVDGSLEIADSEVITRIRVPLTPWSRQVFRRFGNELAPDSAPLTFCGLARCSNGIVEELRLVGSTGGATLVRNREVEADLVGRRIPLPDRDVTPVLEAYAELAADLSAIQRDRFTRLVHWFLLNL